MPMRAQEGMVIMSMGRTKSGILTALLVGALGGATTLSGCSAPTSTTKTETGEGAYHAISSLLDKETYVECSRRIAEADPMPTMMCYDIPYDWGMRAVDDSGTLRLAWQTLCELEVGEPISDPPQVTDGRCQFTFVWEDGTEVRFLFETSGLYKDGNRAVRPVKSPSKLSFLMREVSGRARPIKDIIEE